MADIDEPAMKRARSSDTQSGLNVEAGKPSGPALVDVAKQPQGADVETCPEPEILEVDLQEEFGEETAFILGDPAKHCARPSAASIEMVKVATEDPENLRAFIRERGLELAGKCECAKPLRSWSKTDPESTPTCGVQQIELLAGVDMERVARRQYERRGNGDHVNYALARTVRSNVQNEAAIVLGARGQGNQAKRGACMARALQLFCGNGMECIPRVVVVALLRYP